jgi:uncharacterized protein (TIGR03437 family)
MAILFRLMRFAFAAGLCSVAILHADVLSNKSLTGKYFFREVLLVTDASAQTLTIFGTLTFDGNGSFTYSAQQLTGSAAPASVSGTGTYSIEPSGLATMSDPLRNGTTINTRVGANALVGSNTEAGNNVVSMFAAVAVPSSATTAGTLSGTFQVASLEFANGSLSSRRGTFFQMSANGSGSLGNPSILGEASSLGDTQITQAVSGATYTVNADGTGTATFPPTVSDPNQQLLGGVRSIYISGDGNFFIGGGTGAGGQGMLVGIRTAANATNNSLTGFYWASDLRLESQNYSSYAGSANATGTGNMTWSRRLRTNTGTLDVTALTPYSLNADGSGTSLDNRIAVSANSQFFVGSGLSTTDTTSYELFFGIRMPGLSGSGIFLNPQAVDNVFSYAPPGNPIAPGEFITIFGTGLPLRSSVVPPFPANLNGVRLLINGNAVPLYLITEFQVFAVVPFSITGSTATIVLDNNGTRSNTITVPVAATAPGIATVLQSGVGLGAIQHGDGTPVSASKPALRGETIVVYATGLGQVTPTVADGFPAPGAPNLAKTNSVLAVYVNGICGSANGLTCDASNISYQGLTPTYAGLYQINVAIPMNVSPGAAVPLSLLTANGFTDLVDIVVQ